jgi:hypothetical protein
MTNGVPAEGALPIDSCQALISNALVDAGIVGIDEQIEPAHLNRAFIQVNWLLAQWARKRWLVYRLQEYSFISTGIGGPDNPYKVGRGAIVNMNPRPDRLEYAYVRFLQNTGAPSQFPVDITLDILPSHEDYALILVKDIGTVPRVAFYDPVWPVGELHFWPIPQASIYELHVGFKVVLPRFQSLKDPLGLPPEYESALNWALARRLRASYQMPEDPTINSLARDALNAIRLANVAVPTLRMPGFLRNRGTGRAYDWRGDSDSFS